MEMKFWVKMIIIVRAAENSGLSDVFDEMYVILKSIYESKQSLKLLVAVQ